MNYYLKQFYVRLFARIKLCGSICGFNPGFGQSSIISDITFDLRENDRHQKPDDAAGHHAAHSFERGAPCVFFVLLYQDYGEGRQGRSRRPAELYECGEQYRGYDRDAKAYELRRMNYENVHSHGSPQDVGFHPVVGEADRIGAFGRDDQKYRNYAPAELMIRKGPV